MDPFLILDYTFSGKQHSLYRRRYNLGRSEVSIVFYLINRQHLFYSLPSPRVTTQLNLNIQGTSKCPIINIKQLHLSYIMSIFISLVNSIHLFELCTSDMSNGCLPSFLVLSSVVGFAWKHFKVLYFGNLSPNIFKKPKCPRERFLKYFRSPVKTGCPWQLTFVLKFQLNIF